MIHKGMLLIRSRRSLWRSRGVTGDAVVVVGRKSRTCLRCMSASQGSRLQRLSARHVLAGSKHFRKAPSQERSANSHAVYHM